MGMKEGVGRREEGGEKSRERAKGNEELRATKDDVGNNERLSTYARLLCREHPHHTRLVLYLSILIHSNHRLTTILPRQSSFYTSISNRHPYPYFFRPLRLRYRPLSKPFTKLPFRN